MTYGTFKHLYSEALEHKSIDLYIMERGWQEWMNDMSADDIVVALKKIYHIANSEDKWGALCEEFSNRSVISNLYCIPQRTLQNWDLGKRSPSEYLIMLIAYTVINDLCEKR